MNPGGHHNALVLVSCDAPREALERRRLGFEARPEAAGASGTPFPGHPASWRVVRLEAVAAGPAAALRRLMTAAGGHANVTGRDARGAVVLLAGSGSAFVRFLRAAARQTAIRPAAQAVQDALRAAGARSGFLASRWGRLPLERTLVMGILNVTPDSFSDGGRFAGPRAAIRRAAAMAAEGADLIDIGGESTRPGARPVPLAEELRRVLPVVEGAAAALLSLPAPRPLLSIDTTKAEVARRAVAAGADLINDISGMTFDPAMPAAAAEAGVAIVLQHIRGVPLTMQRAPRYAALVPDIARFLRRRIEVAVRAGIREDRIVVDPGIGFGKKRRDNLALVRNLRALRSLGRPILIGASRKSFLGGTPAGPNGARLEASLAIEALAIAGGADIIRAHDVRAAVRAARVSDAVVRGREGSSTTA